MFSRRDCLYLMIPSKFSNSVIVPDVGICSWVSFLCQVVIFFIEEVFFVPAVRSFHLVFFILFVCAYKPDLEQFLVC